MRGNSSVFSDSLAITATFIVGLASGAILTQLKRTRARAEYHKLLKRALPSPNHQADSIAEFAMKALVIARDQELISILSQVFREKRIAIKECFWGSASPGCRCQGCAHRLRHPRCENPLWRSLYQPQSRPGFTTVSKVARDRNSGLFYPHTSVLRRHKASAIATESPSPLSTTERY